MKMHILDAGRLAMKKRIYVPDCADRTEMIELPVMAVLFRHSEGNILFDTGYHTSVIADAEGRWGKLASVMQPIGAPTNNVIDSIGALGLVPDDINIVVNSHFHPDHAGCNEFFRNARFIVPRKELEVARSKDGARLGMMPEDWDHPMPMEGVSDGYDIMGDGSLVTIELPGHTPGLMGLKVTLENTGKVLLVSDAVNLRRNLDNDEVPRNAWDADAVLASYAIVRDLEAGGSMLICCHDDQQHKALKKSADAYD